MINLYQYWHGERPSAVLRLERIVEKTFTPERGYNYCRLSDEDLPDDIRKLIGKRRIENVSDILRYWLLYNRGGVWIDSDIVFRRPVDFVHILAGNLQRVVTANVLGSFRREASTGIMAAHKGNSICLDLYQLAKSILSKKRKTPYLGIGPTLATAILKKRETCWYCLPEHDCLHQSCQWADYRDSNVEKYQDVINGDWNYAHFTGYNVRWWDGWKPSVLEETVKRCEKELGICD